MAESFPFKKIEAKKMATQQQQKGPRVETYQPGQVIFEEGDAGRKAYIIKAGKVKIVTQAADKAVTLGVLSDGACFGEMAVITSAPRVASAIAEAPTQVFVIDKPVIDKMISNMSPLFRAILMSLIKRVRSLNAFAAEKAPVDDPMISIAHLLLLMGKNSPAISDTIGGLQPDTSFGGVEDVEENKPQVCQVPVKEVLVQIQHILGYTTFGAQKALEKFEKLRLVTIELVGRQKVVKFELDGFIDNVRDVIGYLGESAGPIAELEYIDLKDLAAQLGLPPQRILDAIYNGRITPNALIFRRHLVLQSIEEQGRQLF